MNLATFSGLEPKQFYRILERLFAGLDTARPSASFATRFVRGFGEHFSEFLPIQSIAAIDVLADEPEILYQ